MILAYRPISPCDIIGDEKDKEISMAIQLTPEQEQRIQAVVSTGAYGSTKDALDAAVTAVETLAAPDFEGGQEDLLDLLTEGINSGEPIEVDHAFWDRLSGTTDRMIADYAEGKPQQ